MRHSLLQNILYVHKKLFHFNKKLRFQIPLQMLCEFMVPLLSVAIPAVAVGLIQRKVRISEYLIVMGSITLLYAITRAVKQYLFQRIDYENILTRLQEFYLANTVKMMTTDYINVEPHEKQIIIQKSLNSILSNWVGPELMMKSTRIFIFNVVGLLTYGLFTTALDYKIIIILIIMSVLNIVLTNYARAYEEKHKNTYVKYDRQIGYLYDNSTSLINGKDIRIYQMENWFYRLFKQLIKKRISWNKKIEFRYFIPTISDNVLLFFRDFVAFGMLITAVIDNKIDVAEFVFYIGIIAGFSTWLSQAVNSYSDLSRANLGVNDFRAYEDISETSNRGNGCELPRTNEYPLTIEFKNVSFRYTGADIDTISNFNVKIDGGSKIALVGINGAGKTTLVKLLAGLYYPTEGEILVNGKSITEYDIDEYYKIIGVVFQDVEILAFTIAKNIATCKDEQIDYERVRKSLELAGLKSKIDNLKDRENTYLTQSINKDGIMLSGGEMQKLMLARALYKDAPIIILDEPTAALDPIAESEIYEKYNELTIGKTSLFISHRLSSTKFCDRILFLENGNIQEDGTHEMLMTKKGKYFDMFEIQSHYYKDSLEVDSHEE